MSVAIEVSRAVTSHSVRPVTYRLQGIVVERGRRVVLEVDQLEVEAGRVTAVLGANGAGKSTLLRVLAFLLVPSRGVIEFQGTPVLHREAELVELRRRVTLVAQSPLLFRRSVRANVAYGVRLRGPVDPAWIDRALAAVGLDGFGPRRAWRLSGGESQRVAIARALAIDPDVLLLDEPTTSVDQEFVGTIESLIRSLGAAGKTIVFATHDLEQARRLSDRVIALDAGRLTASPPLEL